jgi:Ca-activated chloride channel family protein
LVITGRFEGQANEGGLTVGGTDPAGSPFMRTLAPSHTSGRAIAQTWARGRLRDLEDRLLIAADPKLEKQILDVSLRFNVLCRFTAFVAVDASQIANPGGARQHIVQPVESPAGWVESVAYAAAPSAPAPARPAFGAAPSAFAAGAVRGRAAGGKGDWMGSPLRAPAPAPAPARSVAFAPREPSDLPEADSQKPALTSYRLRAAELAEQLKSASPGAPADATRTLRLMLVKLRELIEDLSSVAAQDEALELGALREHLESALAAPAPAVSEILDEAIRGLSAFANASSEAAPPNNRRTWQFWK